MELEMLNTLAQIGASITTGGFLLMAWMLERRRADRLESIITTDWLRRRTIELSGRDEKIGD